MESVELDTVHPQPNAFRIFSKLPFKIQTVKTTNGQVNKAKSKKAKYSAPEEKEEPKEVVLVKAEELPEERLQTENNVFEEEDEANLVDPGALGAESIPLRTFRTPSPRIQLHESTDILELAWQKGAKDGHSSAEEDSDSEEVVVTRAADPNVVRFRPNKREYNGTETVRSSNEFEKINTWTRTSVYMSWAVLILFAYLRDFLRRIGLERNKINGELSEMKEFVPLYNDFEAVYTRYCYTRVRDAFERPIASVPSSTVDLLNRETPDHGWSFKFTSGVTNVINVGSYNYLGFAQKEGPCSDAAANAIDGEGLATCTTVHETGRSVSQHELESLVASFLGVEDAICFSMGFATNSMNAPCLVDKNSLIISDQYNHASLILGCRLSGASTKVFRHNDMNSLECILRDAIAYGNPKTHRPFKKILIVVEGIYSMEGSICNLPGIIALKKKYNAYLYLDEAHSIGAMGASGRGIVEYWGCDPKDVDILMGTFTKSFGAAGGYIAGSKRTIDHLRVASPTGYYSSPMSPPIAQQIYSSMSIIMGKDGTKDGEQRIERLSRNSRYLRRRLKQMGFIVYGSDDSPVVPLLIFYPSLIGYYAREMLSRGVGIVVVSFPATSLTESRVRFCVSASHTKEQIDYVLDQMSQVGDETAMKVSIKKQHQGVTIEW